MQDGATKCAACGAMAGAPVAAAAPPAAGSEGLTRNVAGALAYILGIITGVVFLVIEPYKRDKFIRFHAFQSIFYWGVCFVFWMIWSFVVVGMLFSGGLGGGMGLFSFIGLIFNLIRLAMFLGWLFLMYKAYNNEEFKLPVIGDIAAKQAAAA